MQQSTEQTQIDNTRPKFDPSILSRITEAEIAEWIMARLWELRATGLPVHYMSLDATYRDWRPEEPESERYQSKWGMQACGACVVSQPSSEVAFHGVKKMALESSVREKRADAERLLRDAAALEALRGGGV